MGRLDAIRTAERPKMHGRAMLSGPSGAGKTWTALSMARVLVDGDMTKVLVLDTERESALTYADVFVGFQHLPWRPPYDPGELTDTLSQLGGRYEVVLVDSFTHFWRGQGGTLDIADGKIGGWKNARPVQEALVEAVLSVPAHVILCVRSKMDYLVENGGKSVTKVGMAPMQDDTLVYEMNVAFDLDLEHRITVTKSRTPAVPVGRMYPAGLEKKAAEDYADWLRGGVPPANRDDVERIVARFSDIADADTRKRVKAGFVERFGMPHSLTAAQIEDASAWLEQQLGDSADAAPSSEPEPAGSGSVGSTDTGAGGETNGQVEVDEQLRARIKALPEDLQQDAWAKEKALREEHGAGSADHFSGATRLVDQIEKAHQKRVLDAIGACTAAGFESDDDRHALIAAVTKGAVSSAKQLSAKQLADLKKAATALRKGTLGMHVHEDGTCELREVAKAS